MRILMIDIDTLRADHLGCYGYKRDTSPNIDAIAAEGTVFDEYYTPNAPCLPSRASLVTGQYGIRTGVLGHGGTAADLRAEGEPRSFRSVFSENGLFDQFRKAGMNTVSFSTFAERHSAWWFNAGFKEQYNFGTGGGEIASDITPMVLDWIDRRGGEDNWFMHVNFWDPHSSYRTPESFGNPWENEPSADPWITDEVFKDHYAHIGPHGARETNMWSDNSNFPRYPGSLRSAQDAKLFIDNYDCGIRYADDHVGQIILRLKEKGLYNDDLAIIVTSDHGENIGEFGLYAEHATADYTTCRIPMIVKWPGCRKGVRDGAFHDNTDLLVTIRDLLGLTNVPSRNYRYDGISYARTLRDGTVCGHDSLVLSQCAHVCQRSARFGDYIYIRTVHGGYHLFPKEMLFNVREDPHMQNDLAGIRPDLCAEGAKIILDWNDEMMKISPYTEDPMWRVMKEGGPFHSRGMLSHYIRRLEATGREAGARELEKRYPDEL